MLDAERTHAMPVHRTEPGERRGMAVEHRNDAAMGRDLRKQLVDMRARVNKPTLARPLRRGPAGVEPVGGGDGEEADVASVLRHQANRLYRLGRDRAGIGDDDLTIGSGPAQPIGAVHDRLAQLRGHRPLDLFDRTRGEPQIHRAAGLVAQPVALRGFAFAVALDVIAGERENRGELVDKSRLEGGEPVLGKPDQRRRDRLVRAALGRERDARRRGHQNKTCLLVAGVIERIETALNERVIERANRDQTLSIDHVRQTQRRQQSEQIHLGDAELDVLALR